MKQNNAIVISDRDFNDLISMLEALDTGEFKKAAQLEEEMLRADIVRTEDMPAEVVAMNSHVQFLDLDTGEATNLVLTYPWEANIDEGKVSVLAPIGSALIGVSVGQEITWPVPNGRTKSLRVVTVRREHESAVC